MVQPGIDRNRLNEDSLKAGLSTRVLVGGGAAQGVVRGDRQVQEVARAPGEAQPEAEYALREGIGLESPGANCVCLQCRRVVH